MTCAQYPGSEGHFDIDAQTFAEWGVDSIKVDGCYADYKTFDVTYPAFGRALNKTGRPMLYECSAPLFTPGHLVNSSKLLTVLAPNCNYWRMFDDIKDNWGSLRRTVDIFATSGPDSFMVRASGPGHFNDADMILVGMSDDSIPRYQAQMALWSIFSSPLLMSNDLYNMPPGTKEILQNKEIIAVSQDPLGKMGYPIYTNTSQVRVWIKELSPNGCKARWAVVLQNFLTVDTILKVDPSKIPGWNLHTRFRIRNLFAHTDVGRVHCGSFESSVAPESVQMFLFTEAGLASQAKPIGGESVPLSLTNGPSSLFLT
ncbi:Alpha-N-acetylgalactosaminidase, putative [Perkinsus marinus ATCC 50983]|uniref:Alpha-galactosidase n=1 Tax=Perkinsus marinus (strain ATCC 50983 / TXsc) TaxID=423536 RepID=C5LYZ9_PERM5|nr:Alpha-N-acetylgalactosaminidase, putative [Perkinsus marinus ATCC 50983]EEQ98008.1 Alpha-N-acetylgalactosaminidase, putative [Perkinsus marinus ATCC 50983]|eukprot:XP_002765291.1 Alpha-N-acetylgalactosaminidase, putative [Perkinsus marinus ATCC 50983]